MPRVGRGVGERIQGSGSGVLKLLMINKTWLKWGLPGKRMPQGSEGGLFTPLPLESWPQPVPTVGVPPCQPAHLHTQLGQPLCK